MPKRALKNGNVASSIAHHIFIFYILRLMKYFALLLFCVIVPQVYAQDNAAAHAGIEGSWAFNGIGRYMHNCTGPVMEEIHSPLNDRDLLIENDTIWILNYPCRFYEKWTYQVKNDSLYINGNKRPFAHAKLQNNLLMLTFPDCVYQSFTRSAFATDTLNILARDTTNAACLLGKVNIVTYFAPGDEAAFEVIPPLRMPKHISIKTQAMAQGIAKTNLIDLEIQGKARPFFIDRLEWFKVVMTFEQDFKNEIKTKYFFVLAPAGNWWKGEPFKVYYKQE